MNSWQDLSLKNPEGKDNKFHIEEEGSALLRELMFQEILMEWLKNLSQILQIFRWQGQEYKFRVNKAQ